MEYIGINAWFFLVVNLLKVPFQIFAWDNITWGSFSLNLLMLSVIGIGALLGIRLVKLFPEKAFRRFIQIKADLSKMTKKHVLILFPFCVNIKC